MERSDDPDLAMVARLRLARARVSRPAARGAGAAERPEPGQFAGRIAEIKGDIHVALGETDAARTSYLEAMVAPGAEPRSRVPADEALRLARQLAAAHAPRRGEAAASRARRWTWYAPPDAAPTEGAPAQPKQLEGA